MPSSGSSPLIEVHGVLARLGETMNIYLHELKENIKSSFDTYSIKRELYPRLPFGIVSYAFTLPCNLFRNSCT